MFKDADTRKRLLITIGMVIIIRLLFLIPLPGIDSFALNEFINNMMRMQGISRFEIGNSPNGGLTIFGLGIMPFLSACLLLQLASLFIPPLRRFSFGGENGRNAILKLTYTVTLIVCIVQSYVTSVWLENLTFTGGVHAVVMPGFAFRLTTVFTMTASVFLLLFAAGLITRYGIGNGIAIIVVSSLLFRIAIGVKRVYLEINRAIAPGDFILLLVYLIAVASAIYYVTNRSKVLKLKGSSDTAIELKTTYLGTVPIGWAASFIALIPFLCRTPISYYMFPGMVILIFILTFLYVHLVFDSKYVLALMNRFGYSFNDDEKKPQNYLDRNMSKVLWVTSIILITMYFMPNLIKLKYELSYLVLGIYGSSVILVVVGVFSDIIHQTEFLKRKKESGINDWGICYIAFDEIEAKIKSEYLKSKQIEALAEPLRFTWGMPIRTAVDQYRIYVPSDKTKVARELVV